MTEHWRETVERCDRCKCWAAGTCYRYPPSIDGERPRTNPNGWCGEFRSLIAPLDERHATLDGRTGETEGHVPSCHQLK